MSEIKVPGVETLNRQQLGERAEAFAGQFQELLSPLPEYKEAIERLREGLKVDDEAVVGFSVARSDGTYQVNFDELEGPYGYISIDRYSPGDESRITERTIVDLSPIRDDSFFYYGRNLPTKFPFIDNEEAIRGAESMLQRVAQTQPATT